MTRAEMVAWLRFQLPGFDGDVEDGAAHMAQIATELERLGAIADAAMGYVDAPGDCTEPGCVCASAKAYAELERVVAERRVR